MVIVLDEKTLVVQSNTLVEARYRLSVEEQKIIKILIAQIKRDDEDFKDYEFRIQDLAKMLGLEHNESYRVLRRVTERLTKRGLSFCEEETGDFIQATWLSRARYRKGKGTVSLRFDPDLKPLLLCLQSYFTKYELGQVLQFKGQYTIRFFEFKKSFLGRNKKEAIFTLAELWDLLGLEKGEYSIFRNFKNRVLEPARLELLEKTGSAFSWEAVKEGRGGKIVGVRIIFEQELKGEEERKPIPLLFSSQPEQEETPLTGERKASLDALVECGVSEKAARDLAHEYTTEQIQEKIRILEERKEPVENRAGFVVRALREDWHDERADRERKANEERQRREATENRKREIRSLKNHFQEQRRGALADRYRELGEEEREGLKGEFLKTNAFFDKMFRKKGIEFESGIFQGFLMNKLPLLTRDEFLTAEGVILDDEDMRLWNEV